MDIKQNIEHAGEFVKEADAIFITAGAGIGVDSGLPDFRGNEGFWKAYPPIAKLGISFSGMANPRWFYDKPYLAWAFYGHRLNLYRKTTPHIGFSQLLELGKSKKGGYFVFTSNVDGQFQKAGFDDSKIEECHGSIHHFQCMDNCSFNIWNADNVDVEVNEETFEAMEPLPECINCGGMARPNILMFGDFSWDSNRTDRQSQNLSNWLQHIYQNQYKLAIIEVGAGTSVPTVRYESENVAARPGTTLIRINPRESNVPHGNLSIPLGAADGIGRICDLLT